MQHDDVSSSPSPLAPESDSLVDLRCSVALIRSGAVLLLNRISRGDWVLPGGRPRPGESMAACARRETREETGLDVHPDRCAFVLEVIDPHQRRRVVELVFLSDGHGVDGVVTAEAGTLAHWISMDRLGQLPLRPPIAGYLPGVARRPEHTAAYLGNMWRPDGSWVSDLWEQAE